LWNNRLSLKPVGGIHHKFHRSHFSFYSQGLQLQPIKLGIIGCGIAANDKHWPALKALRDKFEIVAVCNNTEQKAIDFARKVGNVPYVLDYPALLAKSEIEAVDVVLPYPLNCEVVHESLKAGKHVIVEKPISSNLKDAKRMLQFDGEFRGVKMVAENFYYHPLYRRLRQILDEGSIGKPYAIFWDLFRVVDRNNRYLQTGWRPECPGGLILDGGIHNIAALRVLFDDIIPGTAQNRSLNPEIGEIDSFSFQFETIGGVLGSLNLFLSSKGFTRNQILILCKNGAIEVTDNKHVVIRDEKGILDEEVLDKDTSYKAEFEDFYEGIRKDKPIISNFERGYRDLEILMTLLQKANR